jgi:hypothetical protein
MSIVVTFARDVLPNGFQADLPVEFQPCGELAADCTPAESGIPYKTVA